MLQPEAKFKRRLTASFAELHEPGGSWWSYLKPVKIGTPDLVFNRVNDGAIWVEAKANGKALSG